MQKVIIQSMLLQIRIIKKKKLMKLECSSNDYTFNGFFLQRKKVRKRLSTYHHPCDSQKFPSSGQAVGVGEGGEAVVARLIFGKN